MTLQVLHFPLTDINLRAQLPLPSLCLLTVPLPEIHFSRFLCRCSQLTVLKIRVCVSLVSRFCFIFSPFFISFFGFLVSHQIRFSLLHATLLPPATAVRASSIMGRVYGPRAVLSLIRFLLFPHTCLWPGAGLGINGTRTRNGNGNVEGAFSLEFQQQQPQRQQQRQLYGRLIKIKRTVSSFGF